MSEVLVGRSTAGVSFDFRHEARSFDEVSFFCVGLGAAETVTISRNVDGSWVTVKSLDANGATNVQVLFTGSAGTPASVGMFTTVGGLYRFESTTPVGVVSIVAQHKQKSGG